MKTNELNKLVETEKEEKNIKIIEKQDVDIQKQLVKGLLDKTHDLEDGPVDTYTGNEIKLFQKKPEWISATRIRVDGKVYTISPFELSWFSYNENPFTIVWENVHPDPREKNALPIIVHEASKIVMIPHRFFTPWVKFKGNPDYYPKLNFIEMDYEYMAKHFNYKNFKSKNRIS